MPKNIQVGFVPLTAGKCTPVHKIKEIGWDDNIRMIDHHEFFLRAAGNIVSVMNPNTAVFHIHNPFDNYYNSFRSDFRDDFYYIKGKMLATRKSLRQDKS